ncbi:MAG: DinB family protein [Cytophagales bacterium]|nr:DinB family protein [Cytophagales bacterium]
MNKIQFLVNTVATERNLYLDQLQQISEEQALWKPTEEEWNLNEITEHLFWAEQGGIAGMWKTLKAIRAGKLERTLDFIHKNMPIEQLIELTWKPKEIVPAVAAPRMGGTLAFWIASLKNLQEILAAFAQDLQEDELRLMAHPHPISGPMDFHQRLEFLGFHIARHRDQCARLISMIN